MWKLSLLIYRSCVRSEMNLGLLPYSYVKFRGIEHAYSSPMRMNQAKLMQLNWHLLQKSRQKNCVIVMDSMKLPPTTTRKLVNGNGKVDTKIIL
ncbi:hypothetical protein NC653_027422 [Populus alba x Populus x berolinensis]|uniref:Uncharacterized protein n=1 Tax=Populus alba x Populus x berolinensis TaxID=444605 RepID=A0AAD6M6D1_9ROSI|nr:hypothetical protein NC653_027422 [Populus alba x Populus x berolinensis]